MSTSREEALESGSFFYILYDFFCFIDNNYDTQSGVGRRREGLVDGGVGDTQ